jgi:hypothetical protein
MLSYTASANTKFAALDAASGSAITRLNSIENKTGSYATTGSNTFVGGQYFSSSFNPTGFTTTASLYTDGGLRVTRDAYISGTLYLNNVTVFGTQSVAYISSSQLNIGTNIISVNTDTPSVRFGGLAVYDSGSTGLTGSMLWDSQDNQWLYSNPSGSTYDSALFLVGPRNSGPVGSEVGISCNFLSKGNGMHHMTSSGIFENGTTTCFYGNTIITSAGTACFSGQICSNGAAFSSTVQINTNTAGLRLNRDCLTNFNGIYYSTANADRWFIGMRENLCSNNHIHYSEALGVDVLTLNQSTGAATFSNSITAGTHYKLSGRTTSYGYQFPDWQIYNTTGGSLAFNNYTSDFLTITSGGNIGIGTCFTIGSYLDSVSQSGVVQQAVNICKSSTARDVNMTFIGSNDAANALGLIIKMRTGATTAARQVVLQGTEIGLSPNHILLQTDGASVGIGGGFSCVSCNPSSLLHISSTSGGRIVRIDGPSTADNYLSLHSGGIEMFIDADCTNSSGIVGTQSNHNLILRTNGTNKVLVTANGIACFACTVCTPTIISTGNVGIGADGSLNRLTVAGHIESRYTTSACTVNCLKLGTYSSGEWGSFVAAQSRYESNIDINLIFGTTNGGTTGERMRILGNGNVGIGTTAPSTILQIAPGSSYANNPTIQVVSSYADGYDAILSLNNTHTGGRNWAIRSTNNSQGDFSGGRLVFQDRTAGESTAVMTLVTGGNIGIGTTSPADKLQVLGSLRWGGSSVNVVSSNDASGVYLEVNGTTTATRRLRLQGINDAGNRYTQFFINAGSSEFCFVTEDIERMRITSAGYVIKACQPAFKAGRSSSYTPGTNTTIVFNDTSGHHFNIGGHYNTSTGIFQAPIAGRYIFSTVVIYENVSAGQAMDDAFYIMRNGSTAAYSFRRAEYEAGYTGNGGYYVDHSNILLNLSVNDCVSIQNQRGGLTVHGNTNYTYFYGYLLG